MSYSIKYFAISPEIDSAFDKKALSLNGTKVNSRTYVFDDIIRPSDFADLGHEVYIGMNGISQRVVDGEEYDVDPRWGKTIEQDFETARRPKSNAFLKEMLQSADDDLCESDTIDHECLFYGLKPQKPVVEDTVETEEPVETKPKKSFWRKLF